MYKFTANEIRDLLIAFVVLSVAFAISTVKLDVFAIISILPIVMVGVGAGFLLHEIGHKFMAMRHGYDAEFKLWPWGLVIALASAFIGFVFAAPGSVNFPADDISPEAEGKISLAGPATNIGLSVAFILIAALVYPLSSHSNLFHIIYLIGTVGFSVNAFLAAFNLLPVYTFDGLNVFKWNIPIWLASFVIAAAMVLLAMTIGGENMVQIIIAI